MATFDRFLAVVGFFRSSGYFKLRKELGDISEIKILVGINIDDIFRKHNKALLMLADEEKAKEIYHNGFKEDIINAQNADFEYNLHFTIDSVKKNVEMDMITYTNDGSVIFNKDFNSNQSLIYYTEN